MRTALFALLATSMLALSPQLSAAQRRIPSQDEVRSRTRDAETRRDRDTRSSDERARDARSNDGRWDWDRSRSRVENDRDRRNNGIGLALGRSKFDRKVWEREQRAWERDQRDFERRSRRWNRYQWDAFRDCERDMWRRAQRDRWDRYDSRLDEVRERRRIRNYCEARVSRW